MKRGARVRTAIRKAAKWGGALVTVLLLVVWIGSGWWVAEVVRNTSHGSVRLQVIGGSLIGSVDEFPVYEPGFEWRLWALQTGDLSRREIVRGGWSFMCRTSGRQAGELGPIPRFGIRVPVWFALTGLVTGTAFAWRADVRAMRRAREGLCAACGYDLVGLAGTAADAVCPECGEDKATSEKR